MHEPIDPTPTASDVLFIGGSYDGEWLTVQNDADFVTLQRRGQSPSLLEVIFNCGPEEKYSRRYIIGVDESFYLFAPVRMSQNEMLAWLLAGYGKAGT